MLFEKSAIMRGVIILISTIVTIVVMVLLSLPRDRKWSCITDANETGVCVPESACASTEVAPLKQCESSNDIIYVCCGETTQKGPTTERHSVEPYIHAGVPKSDEDIQYGMAILFESECGEDDACLSESPWMALLVYEHSPQMHCSGSLITKQYVLTAAHCIDDSPKVISVRLGGNVGCTSNKCVQSPFQDIAIEQAIYHENYVPQLVNDIGLIRLSTQADINFYVRPICLPLTPEAQKTDLRKAQVTGWAFDIFDIDVRANGVLKKAVVQVKDNDYCQQIFRIIRMTEKLVCAVGGSLRSESGGSGGPLYASIDYRRSKPSVQFGVLTSSDHLPGPTSNFIYSRITYYLPWIAGNIRS